MFHKLVKWIRYFFGISKTEANGVVVLIIIMVFIAIGSILITNSNDRSDLDEDQVQFLDSLAASIDHNFYFEESKKEEQPDSLQVVSYFLFDPNTADYEDLRSLGLSDELSNRIIKYRNKGGSFREKDDLAKIYGLSSTQFQRLKPYIKIEEIEVADPINENDISVVELQRVEDFTKFDINNVDSSELLIIDGIGKVISSRLVRFRDKLGGFVRIEQLKEVYGLEEYAYDNLLSKAFISEDFQPRTILINIWPADSLDNHPYIAFREAKVIEAYRSQHGKFNEPGDLLDIVVIDSLWVRKLTPYLEF